MTATASSSSGLRRSIRILILALYVPFGLTEEDYERLSQIAPTVAPPAGVAEGGISWQDLTRTVGVAVGQADAAARIVEEVDALFTQARTDHPEFVGATGLNAYPSGSGTYQAYPPPDPVGRLLTDLGFVVPQPIVDLADGAAWVDLSGEQASLFDIEVMLWLVDDGAARERLLAAPLYSGLTVAREGRHVIYSYAEDTDIAAACSMQTVLSLPFPARAPRTAACRGTRWRPSQCVGAAACLSTESDHDPCPAGRTFRLAGNRPVRGRHTSRVHHRRSARLRWLRRSSRRAVTPRKRRQPARSRTPTEPYRSPPGRSG